VEHIREWRSADDERRRQICREAQALRARA
ncbi:DUF1289 domain-containing protein, partial [Pseudomonas poae]|nr:DUF1289 domain-containing protein [Pseudomonas poae]